MVFLGLATNPFDVINCNTFLTSSSIFIRTTFRSLSDTPIIQDGVGKTQDGKTGCCEQLFLSREHNKFIIKGVASFTINFQCCSILLAQRKISNPNQHPREGDGCCELIVTHDINHQPKSYQAYPNPAHGIKRAGQASTSAIL